METRELTVRYGSAIAIDSVSLRIEPNRVTALIGPSGCGKSTFLRSLNRMNETIEGARTTGSVWLDGQDVYARSVDPVEVRRRIGMVFQKSNPFPKSVFDNVAFGLRIAGERVRKRIEERGEQALRSA
ncbi:MAG: ATP-binding cassette domain-containing protein, partial [Sandaracinaceae bacterium]|nr:ATP-binding cassette domain-containing protein [Sandaracinaceae bacterium]